MVSVLRYQGIVIVRPSSQFTDEGSMMVHRQRFGLATMLVCGLVALAMESPARGETLTVAAASSLRAPFQEILRIFELEYGVPIEVRYGASHTLRRQIEQGAPIDVFLSESLQEVQTLHQKGLTLLGGPRQYAQTSMVVVMSSASTATSVSFGDASLPGAWRVALVDPKASSVGVISVKALKQIDPLAHHHARLVTAPDTDEVVRLISGGDADLGIVYRADAINSGQVRIINEAPVSIPVLFGQAVVSTCRQTSLQAAEQFMNFMMSPRIQKLLLKYGFDAMPARETVG